MRILWQAALILSLLAASAPPAFAKPVPTQPSPQVDVFGFGATGINLGARDLAVRPGDDFYLHANGAWTGFVRQRLGPIDASFSLHAQLNEEVEAQVRAIIENPADDAAGRQVAALYRSFTDEARVEQLGITPIRPYLQRIAAIRDRRDLIQTFAANGYNMPVAVGVIPDAANPSRHALIVTQGGTRMPTRDHYLREGPEFDRYRTAYRTYITTALRLARVAEPEAKTAQIFELERRLAESHWTPERARDVRQTYNAMSRAELAALAPQFDWNAYLDAMGFRAAQRVVVREPSAIQAAGRLLDEVPLDTWKAWLTFHFIDAFAPYLSTPFQDAEFAFDSRALHGMRDPHPRWSRGVKLVDDTLGESLGSIYMQRHFPAESNRVLTELVGNVRSAFTERLQRLEWMDDATRREALAKLQSLEAQIGGPTRPLDLTSVRIEPNDLVGNIMRLSEYGLRRDGERLSEPVDRSLWPMTAQTVGASYNTLTNQITFPAGILQRPLFHPSYDAAVNYGRIGSAIGHELGHGFDDQGRRFDREGRLRDWWSPAAAARFEELATKLGAQFAAYEPLPGFKVNAEVTMGENIGDLGGLEIAYEAYRRHVARHGEPPVVGGLTGDQRFFLAYAQTWASHMSDNLLRTVVLTDEHSPPALRVNGIVRNMDAWYRAFDIRPGNRLYLPPEQRVRIWSEAGLPPGPQSG
ncbi:MAG TPA: M13 family metallopeptidase [Allosphingosinicella sp.]